MTADQPGPAPVAAEPPRLPGPAPQRRRPLVLFAALLVVLNLVVLLALGFLTKERVQSGDQAQQTLTLQLASLRERVAKLESTPNPAAGLSERVAALESGLAALPKQAGSGVAAVPAPDQTAALADLSKRLSALEARPATDTSNMPALEQRVAALETARLSQAAETQGRIDALDKDLREAVKPALAGLAQAAPQQATKAELQALTGRLATLEQSDEKKLVKSAASALAVSVLAETVRTGAPYENELAAVTRLAPPELAASPLLDTLRRQAATGLPTQEQLIASFPAAARAARDAQTPRDTGMMGTLRRTLGGLVSFRVPGAPTETALETMSRALRRDDLDQALAAARTLDDKPRAALEPWLARARLRQSGISAIMTLQSSAIRALAATASQ